MTRPTSDKPIWRDEVYLDHTRFGLRVKSELYRERSAFQEIAVIDTVGFGRVLVIDGVFMTSEYDEFLYHEMLVHPAMTSAPSIKSVLVIGGGDGGTVREALRHSEVQKCVMIEIDEKVVRASQQFLPTIGMAWDDPRLDVRFVDGIDYVKSSKDIYDVILVDGTDPVGPGAALFDTEFFVGCKRLLNRNGVLAIQSESPLLMLEAFVQIQRELRQHFAEVHPYFGPVPLYGTGVWSWTWCSDAGHPLKVNSARQNAVAPKCKNYNPSIHAAAFALPNYVKAALNK